MDAYTNTTNKIKEATTKEELVSIFKEYDAIEGAKMRRMEEIKKLIKAHRNDISSLEIELSGIDDHGYMFKPIKEIVAVKIFDLSLEN
jgi:hypothetical protein